MKKSLDGWPQPNPPSCPAPKWTSFGLRRPEHLMHQEFSPPPSCCLQMAHFCKGLAVFSSKQHFTKYVHWHQFLYVGKSMGQRDSNWFPMERQLSAKDQLAVPKSKIQQGWTWICTVNLQIARESVSGEPILWWRKVPYFLVEIWDTLHDIWRQAVSSRWRDPRGIHLHENPLNCICLGFSPFRP